MSDKEAVKVLIAHRIRFMDDFGWDKSTIEALDIAIASLATESEPAVPQEMSTKEFFTKWFEICNTYLADDCYHCPLYLRTSHRKFAPSCMYLMMTDSKEAIAIVEKWAREHPEET